MRTSQRPDFILLSSQSSDREGPVLYPDQWEDRVSLAGRYHMFYLQLSIGLMSYRWCNSNSINVNGQWSRVWLTIHFLQFIFVQRPDISRQDLGILQKSWLPIRMIMSPCGFHADKFQTPPSPVSEFQVMEAHPNAAGQRPDKPSPDSGCSLGFFSSLSSPDRPTGDGGWEGKREKKKQTDSYPQVKNLFVAIKTIKLTLEPQLH